jgi:pilus assembly protein CpaF
MGMIKTHHSRCINESNSSEYQSKLDFKSILQVVIPGILRECPVIVAEVAGGQKNKQALEREIVREIDTSLGSMTSSERDIIIKHVFDYMFGYGLLQKYIEDEEISDIDGTRYNEFSIKRLGKRCTVNVDFESEQSFETYCKLIAVRNGGILNENDSHCRIVDEKNRLRINISIRPRSVSGPCICIRKHRMKSYTLKQLESEDMFDENIALILKSIAIEKLNIVLCGKGASGKTTLLRAIVNSMSEMDRIMICESEAEIYPDKKYCMEQRIKRFNEGGTMVTLGDLVRDGLTMSLDTYIIGEIVGPEAWEFVRAIHTGHRGLTTTHALSASDAVLRLVTLSKSSGINESEEIVREMIGRSLDIIIFMENFKVKEIIKVSGYDPEAKNKNECNGFRFKTIFSDPLNQRRLMS